MKKVKNEDIIELNPKQVKGLLSRLEKQNLEDADYGTIKKMMESLLFLKQAYEDKDISTKRLIRLLFGPSTESARNIIGASTASKKRKSSSSKRKKKKKPKGHGRNGKDDFPGARTVKVAHPNLNPSDPCPECLKGKVYKSVKPGFTLRFIASVPVEATVYERDKLRCNLCGEIFTAPEPEEAGTKRYDETVSAMLAVLKYGYGIPFYRIEKLQESFGIPLPASTQWEILTRTTGFFSPVYEEMIRQAAQGDLIHNDDTGMKILAMMNLEDSPDGEEQDKDKRSGLFTTGILSVKDDLRIALYFTGRKHAGENLRDLLEHRETGREPPIQMCDALSRNLPKPFQTILANCLSHGRRNFVDIYDNWPKECKFVIDTLGKVYKHDDKTQKRGLSPPERLRYHQANSGPLMEKLKKWMKEQFEQKNVEPNSGLGKAFNYMTNHWEALTLFLEVEGAPLHNNLCEQVLKRAVLHRKNALFYKTQHGADVGDMFMSLIHTCNLAGANPFEYLIAIQLHHREARDNPHLWMPWNYKERISEIAPKLC